MLEKRGGLEMEEYGSYIDRVGYERRFAYGGAQQH